MTTPRLQIDRVLEQSVECLQSDLAIAIDWIERHREYRVNHHADEDGEEFPVLMVEYGRAWLLRARARLVQRFEAELTGKSHE